MKGRFVGGCNDGPFAGAGTLPNLKNGTFDKLTKLETKVDYKGAWVKALAK